MEDYAIALYGGTLSAERLADKHRAIEERADKARKIVQEAIERLQLLEHSGAVPCRFASIECFPPWNQSLMAVAEESPVRRYGQTRHRDRDRAPWPPTARGALPRAHVGPLRLRLVASAPQRVRKSLGPL